jgi:tetratricopeptide (TPR) repeat protein
MWYLIIPPVVVIVSLALLLWFLSNRSEQVSIQERMENIGRQSSFRTWQTLRVRQALFRFLERATRSLKVFSLRVHNWFHVMGQSFHERRNQSDMLITSFLNFKKKEEISSRGPISFFEDSKESVEIRPEVTIKQKTSVDSEVKTPERRDVTQENRPMVSERAVIPETKPNKVIARDMKEEERLIKKIAANPKSVSAYEALGDYYLERGDVNDAKACYRQVLKLSPVHRMVKVKIRKLERMMEEQAGRHAE